MNNISREKKSSGDLDKRERGTQLQSSKKEIKRKKISLEKRLFIVCLKLITNVYTMVE